jgi:hypothetical protein
MSDNHSTQVFVRSPDGAYLRGAGAKWEFTRERIKATVFDYVRDRIAEQLEGIQKTHGLALVAVLVNAQEIHETCDSCEQIVVPSKAFFDGKQFLCGACKVEFPQSR